MGRGYWAGAKEAVRAYPKHKAELQRLHSQNITANLNGMPGGSGASRTTENIATKELPPAKQKDYEAVHLAVEQTQRQRNGDEIMKLIRLKYWQGREFTLEDIAKRLHYSPQTMKRWHSEFIRKVLKNRGLED